MVDSCRPAHLNETVRLLARFAEITDVPFVIAANKQDDPAALPLSYIRRRLHIPFEIPIIHCVANDRESVKNVLLHLLNHIEQAIPS